MKKILLQEFEMVEKEIIGADLDKAFIIVMELIFEKENYFEMNKEDRFDYLVDALVLIEW